MSYVEIDLNTVSGKITINRDQISHYRAYIPNDDEKSTKPMVNLYLKGNLKAVRVYATHDEFKRKVGANNIDIFGLSNDKVDKLNAFISDLRKE